MLRSNVFAIMFLVGMVCLANYYVNGDKDVSCKATYNGGCKQHNELRIEDLHDLNTVLNTVKQCFNRCDEMKECAGFFIKDDDKAFCGLYKNGCINDGNTPYTYYAMDDCKGKEEFVTAHVGSSESNSKTITIDGVFSCPSRVDKTNWLSGTKYNDKFRVSQTGNEITATRTDTNGGWSMDLKFQCGLELRSNNYVVGMKGSLCQTGAIQNKLQCQNAAKSLGYTTNENFVEINNDYPGGCYVFLPNIVFFNTADPGKRNINSRPICSQEKGTCIDFPKFKDGNGATCEKMMEYGHCKDGKPMNVSDKTFLANFNGISALDACCGCGGGQACRDLWATYVHKRGSITTDLSEVWSPIYTKTDLSTLLKNTKVGEIYTMVLQVSSECLHDVEIGLSGEEGRFKTNVPGNSKNKVIVITDVWKGTTGMKFETRTSCNSKKLTIHEIELFKGKNRCLKSEPNLPVRCCELKGVPRKCIYACDLKTDKKISQREAIYYDKCTDYMDVIDSCKKDIIVLEDMKACCNLYDVHKTPDCHELVCNSKCEDQEWRFLEKHPKKECKNHVKNLKSCCGGV